MTPINPPLAPTSEESALDAREGGSPIPLESVSVECSIDGFAARTVITQCYRNAEDRPIEAVYTFPLDEGAAVCAFEAWIGERHVVGRVRDREEAFEEYDDAVAEGHGAYLLDEERADVFTASLGNVPPRAEVKLRVTTVAELSHDGDALRYVLPTTVPPRYAPVEDRGGVGRSTAETLNPPVALEVPYRLQLEVRVRGGSPLRSVESPSHPISVAIDVTEATVRLAQCDAALDRDFVLLVREAEPHRLRAHVERDDRGRCAACVELVPRLAAGEGPVEMILVVDRSGSMQGSSIAEARNAIQLCLRSLPQGSFFNVVGFGSSFEMLFPESRPYNEETLAEASRHVAVLDADLGGTEILAPLETVLKAEQHAELPRVLLVLTDGDVTNTDPVLELVRRHAGTTRVFAIGIGHGPSRHLLQGLARAGGGSAEFVAPGDRLEAPVLRQVRRALAPALTDVTVEWRGVGAQPAPWRAPALFGGEPARLYALLEGEFGVAREASVVVRARGPEGPVEYSMPLELDAVRPGSLVPTLWARARLRDLEEGSSEFHARARSQQSARRAKRVRREIVRVATEFGLASRETSFIAIEERDEPVEGEAVLRRVRVALTRGWGGIDQLRGHVQLAYDLCSTPPSVPESALKSTFYMSDDVGVHGHRERRIVPIAPTVRPLDRLVALQRVDGAWDLDFALLEVLGLPDELELVEASRALGEAAIPDALIRQAIATALALSFIETQAAEARDEWALLAAKAERWLAAHLADAVVRIRLRDAVRAVLAALSINSLAWAKT